MALLRHGGMGRLFANAYAPSTLGSFVPCARSPSAMSGNSMPWRRGSIEVHGYSKQGSGYGYSGVRGLNALLATVSTKDSAPVVVAQRLRKGSCGSPRGAARLVADGLKTTATLAANSGRALVRADSAFYGHAVAGAARRASKPGRAPHPAS